MHCGSRSYCSDLCLYLLGSILTSALFHLSCSAALCDDPLGIDHGMVTFTGNSVDDTATYSCDPGFELIGDVVETCTQVNESFAAFSPELPVCRREYSAYSSSCMPSCLSKSHWSS